MTSRLPLLFATVATVAALGAADLTLTIAAGQPTGKVGPLHHGLMTEEINHCYDGGLYAELVQNRAFRDDHRRPVHWSLIQDGGAAATMALDGADPLNAAITTSLRLDVTAAGTRAGIANAGYWGIPVKPGTTYRASFHARSAGDPGPFTVAIEHEDGSTIYAKAVAKEVPSKTPLNTGWKRYEAVIATGAVTPTTKGRLTITVAKPGAVWFALVSLFPPTWNDRPNGLRPDLMQLLADMKPRFLRFPGGNYLEGNVVAERFPWQKTLGELTERPGHPCPWGYRSSDGMGLLEFLLWCEDLKMEPILGVYAGYSLNAKAPGNPIKAGPELEPFVQEALDEIEYIIGDATTTWGARRVKDGHPAPFKLTYVEIGNEDWFDKTGSYDGRYAQFQDAIKKRYPHIQCISSVGFEQPKKLHVTSRQPDLVDEHYYRSTADFDRMSANHYERYARKPPAIFVGEWAAHEDIVPWDAKSKKLAPTPTLKAALGDAIFMAAMERNADLIPMQCYAPIFVNVNPGAWQWRPDLIGYDNLTSYGSPSYYAIKLFSTNLGDDICKGVLEGFEAKPNTPPPLHHSATRDSRSGALHVKLVNLQDKAQVLNLRLHGMADLAATAAVQTLSAPNLTDTNSLQEPKRVVPVASTVNGVKPAFAYTVPPYSITVLTFSGR